MKLHIRQLWTLAQLCAVETTRQPICLLLTTTAVVTMALSPLLLSHSFGEEGKLVRDSSLACHFVFGLLVGGYAACTALTREISAGTAATVLSKPVSRTLFFLAKFLGVAATVILFSAVATAAVLLSERVGHRHHQVEWGLGLAVLALPVIAYALAALWNFSTRRPFVSAAFNLLVALYAIVLVAAAFLDERGRPTAFAASLQLSILPVSALLTMALVVLAAIAMLLATRLALVGTMTGCIIIFMVGLMSEYYFAARAESSALCALLYALVPDWQHFWCVDALIGGRRVPWGYVAQAALYATLYVTGVLSLGALSFTHREIR